MHLWQQRTNLPRQLARGTHVSLVSFAFGAWRLVEQRCRAWATSELSELSVVCIRLGRCAVWGPRPWDLLRAGRWADWAVPAGAACARPLTLTAGVLHLCSCV